jgi:putative hydrolase of the HAD superfamily
LYRDNKISKSLLRSERFGLTLNEFSVDDNDLAVKIGDEYIKKCPLQTTLFPYAVEILNYLKTKYKLHIITNGFDEVQHIKLKASGLTHFFSEIVTSEKVDVKKPDPKIFNYALTKAKTTSVKSIMIGDDLPVDILGAKQVGMSQIYFNPDKKNHNEKIDYEISSLDQIKEIL